MISALFTCKSCTRQTQPHRKDVREKMSQAQRIQWNLFLDEFVSYQPVA